MGGHHWPLPRIIILSLTNRGAEFPLAVCSVHDPLADGQWVGFSNAITLGVINSYKDRPVSLMRAILCVTRYMYM